MRASRLLSILVTLQARGQVTAQTLADECGVSLRTIYRDIDALSNAGVPVISERGVEGGYRLLDGYRTRLNGMTSREVESLFLLGLSSLASDLGLGLSMATAQSKLQAALPDVLRERTNRLASRFHLDLPTWFGEVEQPAYLTAIAEAVWEQKAIKVRYQSWKAQKERRIKPLGIVLKGGAWYFVGQVDNGHPRTYRVGRILELDVLDEFFERPTAFDLAAYWQESIFQLEAELHPIQATLRLSPIGLKMLDAFVSAYARTRAQIGEVEEPDGWRTVVLPVGPIPQAAADLLRFGTAAEVLGPDDLRARMKKITSALGERYAG